MGRERQQPSDQDVRRRIRGISVINFMIGVTELAAGAMTNSSTLTMAGVHDVADGELYRIKHKAATELDPAHKRRLRRRGAMTLMGVALGMGSYEIASDLAFDNHRPETTAVAVGVLAAGANIAAAVTLHGKRHHHDAGDSWRHIIQADLPSSLVTAMAAPLSVRYPGIDTVGAAIQTVLAVRVGVDTLRLTKE